jgi:hypothetical protein
VFPTALRKPKYWQLIFFWSGVIESVHPYINGYGKWLDMAANTIGIACALFIAQLITWIICVNSKHKYTINAT